MNLLLPGNATAKSTTSAVPWGTEHTLLLLPALFIYLLLEQCSLGGIKALFVFIFLFFLFFILLPKGSREKFQEIE